MEIANRICQDPIILVQPTRLYGEMTFSCRHLLVLITEPTFLKLLHSSCADHCSLEVGQGNCVEP
uniref:Uncharacterized protein n=1 Tax=Arion vulgaris TaxID=1028688 RepID=A0A0B7BVS5_9EUPU